VRRNIWTVPDYADCKAYDAFFINAGTFTSTYADDNYANDDNHAGDNDDTCTVLHGHAVEFSGGNVSFSTGHAGGDANNDKPEYIA
jgi:hypothetical protein